MTVPPKTLEYSTIKRSRKRVVMIVVLVLASLAVALVGRALFKRLYTTYSAYSYERGFRLALERDIEEIRTGTIKFDSHNNPVRFPVFKSGTFWSSKNYESEGMHYFIPPMPTNPPPGYETTTACLARLNGGTGSRYVGVNLTVSMDMQPRPVTAVILVATEASLSMRAQIVQRKFLPLITFQDSLSVIPGTATSADRATFKVIADGVEKTFVVILRKDDTVAFEEQQ